jgi:hypothetical protein
LVLTGDNVAILVCAAVFGIDDGFQAFECRQRFLESVVIAATALKGFCGVNPCVFGSGVGGFGGIQMAYRALCDHRLDLAVKSAFEIERKVHLETEGVLDHVGIDQDLVRNAEVERKLILVHELAVLL